MSVLPVQAVYRLTEKDADEAQVHDRGWERRAQQIVAVAALIAAPLFALGHQFPFAVLALLISGVLFFGQWHRNRHPPIKEHASAAQIKFAASEDRLELAYASEELNVKWSSVQYVKDTENLFLLYLQPRVFYIVPKRHFAPADLGELRSLLDRKLGERSRLIAGASQMKLAVFLIAVAATVIVVFLAVHANQP